jgi:acyl dehydratase
VDVDRATRESPTGATIAHGFLTLSTLAGMTMQLGVIPADALTTRRETPINCRG